MDKRGIAICTYNRGNQIRDLVEAVLKTKPDNARVVVCDDGSTDETSEVLKEFNSEIIYICGPNQGVAANKNRALFLLQDCHFIAIIEDDLFPVESGWFELYENTALSTGINHFCRISDEKAIEETVPEFSEWLKGYQITPIYGPSPRGDLTFITSKVVQGVGAFNPKFQGAGYAHGEWSDRVMAQGFVPHPLRFIDIKEARDKFEQRGDTDGGRWLRPKQEIKDQLKANGALRKKLRKTNYVYHPLVIS